ncbi:Rossmann-like and DUF2520 domain-containing protein [Corynebacterium sp. 335C]
MLGAPRLTAGVISAGAVGTAVGEALERAGHRVTGVVARSEASLGRARLRLPGARIGTVAEVCAGAELIVLAVPDGDLPAVAEEVSRHVGAGRIVLHCAGSLGRAVLDHCALAGALTIAAHPAMTFTGRPGDADRLNGCPWGVTAGDDVARTVAELLIGELGGRAVAVPEELRGLYHAGMAHGANHLAAVVADAVTLMNAATGADGQPAEAPDRAAALLRPLLEASLDNALRWGSASLTGPAARDDADTVLRHLGEIGRRVPGAAAPYAAMARRAAELRGSSRVIGALDERAGRGEGGDGQAPPF